MLISVTFVSIKSGQVTKQFNADSEKYFSVNKNLKTAELFLDKGFSWEGAESFGTYIRIEKA